MISFAGLCKMACCNLAESFENSASVTVGYSDAISGARQIKMLGLAGTYTQILDENRPIMRGLSALRPELYAGHVAQFDPGVEGYFVRDCRT